MAKKLKVGLVPSVWHDISVMSMLGHIANVTVLSEAQEIKESEFDLLVIGNHIGINPYNSFIIGYTEDLTDPIAHRFLAKHLASSLTTQIKIVGIGDGAINLYAELGLKISVGGPSDKKIKFQENDSVEYTNSGFVFNNCYGMIEFDRKMWERIILDCFNDGTSLQGSFVTNPQGPTEDDDENDW